VAVTNTFAGARLDRAGERRTDDAWVQERLADPASRAIVITPDGPRIDGDQPALSRVTPGAEAVLLGLGADGVALFAVDADEGGTSLRDAVGRLSRQDAGVVA